MKKQFIKYEFYIMLSNGKVAKVRRTVKLSTLSVDNARVAISRKGGKILSVKTIEN